MIVKFLIKPTAFTAARFVVEERIHGEVIALSEH